MISQLEKEITIRYLKTRKKDGFLNVISIFSFLGISLGVAVLIIVMSVMNGFRSELIQKIIGFNAHAVIKPYENPISEKKLNNKQLVNLSNNFLLSNSAEGVLINKDYTKGLLLRGYSHNEFQKLGLKKIHILQASGSSYLGLALAKKILNFSHWKITGIGPRLQPRMRNIREITNKALNYLNKKSNNKLKLDYLDYKDLNWDLSFYGQGYGIQTKKSIDAIKLLAEKEAIFLDPIYTGKAMSGLIEYAKSNKIDKDNSVVFIHSGGTPNLFTYSNELLATN